MTPTCQRPGCGQEIPREPGRSTIAWQARKFCSRACSNSDGTRGKRAGTQLLAQRSADATRKADIRIENARHLLEAGETPSVIADRLNTTRANLARQMRRRDHHDIAAYFERDQSMRTPTELNKTSPLVTTPNNGDAACYGWDPETFFPSGSDPNYEPARVICSTCPLRQVCLSYALERGEKWGMWGGMTPEERDRLRRRINTRAAKQAAA